MSYSYEIPNRPHRKVRNLSFMISKLHDDGTTFLASMAEPAAQGVSDAIQRSKQQYEVEL